MFAELLSSFMGSDQARQATSALTSRGYAPSQIEDMLQAATHGAAKGMHAQTAGDAQPSVSLFNIFGGHAGTDFLTSALSGLLRGDGVVGALEDGAMGAIGGHVAEYIASKCGVDEQMARQVAAVVTPYIVHYVHEKLSSHPHVVATHGASPHRHHHRQS